MISPILTLLSMASLWLSHHATQPVVMIKGEIFSSDEQCPAMRKQDKAMNLVFLRIISFEEGDYVEVVME